MIDFLIKDSLSIKEVYNFILELFEGDCEEILFFSVEYFNNNIFKINIDKNKIFFLFSYVNGDASILVQLFNFKHADIVKKIINHSSYKKIPCYIPIDDFFWIYIDKYGRKKKCAQVDGVGDDFFCFSELEYIE